MGWLVNVVNSFGLTILTSLNKRTTSCNFNQKNIFIRKSQKLEEKKWTSDLNRFNHQIFSQTSGHPDIFHGFFEVMAISIALAAMGRTSRTSCRASDGGQHRDIQGHPGKLSLPGHPGKLSLPGYRVGRVFSVVWRGKPRENHRRINDAQWSLWVKMGIGSKWRMLWNFIRTSHVIFSWEHDDTTWCTESS